MLLLLTAVFLVLVFLKTPIAFVMGLTSVTYFIFHPDIPLLTIPQRMMYGGYSFSLLAIPFFILAGELMNKGGITKRLVDFTQALIGWVTGGLAQVNILANVFMAGISGSAVADVAATGSILVPAMERAGYSRKFASALTAAAGCVGPIIPPSIPFVVLGSITGLSVTKLFLGGVIPGFIMAFYMMVVTFFISRRRGYPKTKREPLLSILRKFIIALPVLGLPFIIVGGIFSGMFTATEASAIAAVYSFFLGVFFYKEIGLAEIPRILADSALTTATILFILSIANSLSWVLAREQLGVFLVKFITKISQDPILVMMMLNIFWLLLGMFLEPLVIIMLLTPFLIPLFKSLNIDLIYASVVMVVNLMIGLLTPPVGSSLFVISRIAKIQIEEFLPDLVPFIIALLFAVVTITLYPPLILWLPNMVK